MTALSVVHVVIAGEVGGAERFVADIAATGRRAGVAHSVALCTSNARVRTFFERTRLPVVDLGLAPESPLHFLARNLGGQLLVRLIAALRAQRADVVHLHTFGSHVVGTRAALHSGVALVRTEHSTRVYRNPSCWPFSRWSLGHAHAVVAVSEHVAQVARSRAPQIARKLSVIRNGVALPARPLARPASDGRTDVQFLVLARLDRRKGLELALEGVSLVPRSTLMVVGDGEERPMLERTARALALGNRVHFAGYHADPGPFLATADVGLCTSREEGLGIGLLEMMAHGLPIVTVPVGGVPEIVRTGENGIVSQKRSAPALAQAMEELVDDVPRRRRLGAGARRFVEAHHTLEAVHAGYHELYRAIVSRRKNPLSSDHLDHIA